MKQLFSRKLVEIYIDHTLKVDTMKKWVLFFFLGLALGIPAFVACTSSVPRPIEVEKNEPQSFPAVEDTASTVTFSTN